MKIHRLMGTDPVLKRNAGDSLRIERQKKRLRLRLQKKLTRLSSERRKVKSLKILERLLVNHEFRKAKNILMYASLPVEVQTPQLIQSSLGLGKNIFLPRVNLKTKKLEIGRVRQLKKDLIKGTYGILEPRQGKKGDARKLDLVIVPGLAFDRKGRRLGRGAGYYDRFLGTLKKTRLIGLAFREQRVKRIPVAPHDIAMHQVITD